MDIKPLCYGAGMRSYGQYCSVAKALDLVGDRWSLLIVRELLVRGGCRYTDLQYGLPGIATNLLADRLRDLERAGVVRREAAPPPVATTLFRLTPRGEELKAVVHALGQWGSPLLADAPNDDEFRSHWLALPLDAQLRDHNPDRPPVTIELRTGDQPMVVETANGRVRARPGGADHPDALLEGSPQLVLSVLVGKLGLDAARRRGLRFDGNPRALQRVRP